jgi:hypothetical protein
VVSISGACAFKPEIADFIVSLNQNERVTDVILSNISEEEGQVTFSCSVTFVKMAEAESEVATEESPEAVTEESDADGEEE